jgi:hypothetical protein
LTAWASPKPSKSPKADRLDRIDFNLTFIHPVSGPDLHAWTLPDPDAAGDFSATDSFAKTFREHHGEKLTPGQNEN